jgi:hypothetical protein
MTAFDSQALYAKSKLFISRALENDTDIGHEVFQLWATLSLEVLGKSSLAFVHPALIAEPDDDSILAACGHQSKKPKTITATTVFRRLNLLIKDFTNDQKESCTLLTDRRNAELHSGALPFAATKRQDWLGRFWQSCDVILKAQNKTLTDWIGKEAADAAIREIEQLQVAEEVRLLLLKHRGQFDKQCGNAAAKEQALMLSKTFSLYTAFNHEDVDKAVRYTCPACNCMALLGGRFWQEYESGDEDGVVMMINYVTEVLICKICHLTLDGRAQLTAANVPEDFEVEKEPDYDDYGND